MQDFEDINEEDDIIEGGLNEEPLKYEELVTEEPEREVLEEFNAPRSVEESEELEPQLSDIKAIVKQLMPVYSVEKLNTIAKTTMVSRIFPDNLLDRVKLVALMLIEEYEEEETTMPLLEILIGCHDMHLIGYEGRRIVELLELAGVAHEEELEKIAREIGA